MLALIEILGSEVGSDTYGISLSFRKVVVLLY